MNIVALDAAGRYAISALKRDEAVPTYAAVGGEGAVRSVYASLDRVLEEGGGSASELSAIVVNTGPGSWTGVRIAVTYAAGLAFGADVKVFGFSGFEIGKRLAASVAFIDQLGKTVGEAGAEDAALTVELFPEISAEAYLAQRSAWLNEMLKMGAEALTSGQSGDPLELQTTYFQEFLAGARK